MLNALIDIIKIVIDGLIKLPLSDLYLTAVISAGLAFITFIACRFFGKLWNKVYRLSALNTLMSIGASVFAMFFVLAFVGMANLEDISKETVNKWKVNIKSNEQFLSNNFIKSYYAVKSLGLEDFSQYPQPEQNGNTIPLSHKESKLLVGQIAANDVIQNFKDEHGFLGLVLDVDAGDAPEAIKEDMQKVFQKTGAIYLLSDGIEISSNIIRDKLIHQSPIVVKLCRSILVLLFVVAQLIPLCLISYSAYRQLKINL